MIEADLDLLAANPQGWFDLSFATEPNPGLVIPKPAGKDAPPLYPYQQAAAQQAWFRKHAYCGHHPGAGKSPIALAVSCMYTPNDNIMVVCPPPISRQWAAAGLRWTGLPWTPLTTKDMLRGYNHSMKRVIVPDSILDALPAFRHRLALLVIDECHRMKERTAKRTRAIFGQRGIPGLSAYADKILALSGTPVPNNPVELFPVLHATDPVRFPSFGKFCERYSPPTTEYFSGHEITVYDQATNTEELSFALRSTLMIRPKREAILGQLPPIARETVWVGPSLSPVKMDSDRIAGIFAGDVKASEEEKTAIATARREVGLSKVDEAVKLIQVYMEGGDAPMVWCWHRSVAEAIGKELKCPVIHGGMAQPMREAAKDDFVSKRAQAIVCTLQAAGTGIDGFQHRSNLGIYVERDYVPQTMEQADGRLFRTGQTSPVRFITIMGRNPIDNAISKALVRKAGQIKEICG